MFIKLKNQQKIYDNIINYAIIIKLKTILKIKKTTHKIKS